MFNLILIYLLVTTISNAYGINVISIYNTFNNDANIDIEIKKLFIPCYYLVKGIKLINYNRIYEESNIKDDTSIFNYDNSIYINDNAYKYDNVDVYKARPVNQNSYSYIDEEMSPFSLEEKG